MGTRGKVNSSSAQIMSIVVPAAYTEAIQAPTDAKVAAKLRHILETTIIESRDSPTAAIEKSRLVALCHLDLGCRDNDPSALKSAIEIAHSQQDDAVCKAIAAHACQTLAATSNSPSAYEDAVADLDAIYHEFDSSDSKLLNRDEDELDMITTKYAGLVFVPEASDAYLFQNRRLRVANLLGLAQLASQSATTDTDMNMIKFFNQATDTCTSSAETFPAERIEIMVDQAGIESTKAFCVASIRAKHHLTEDDNPYPLADYNYALTILDEAISIEDTIGQTMNAWIGKAARAKANLLRTRFDEARQHALKGRRGNDPEDWKTASVPVHVQRKLYQYGLDTCIAYEEILKRSPEEYGLRYSLVEFLAILAIMGSKPGIKGAKDRYHQAIFHLREVVKEAGPTSTYAIELALLMLQLGLVGEDTSLVDEAKKIAKAWREENRDDEKIWKSFCDHLARLRPKDVSEFQRM